MDTEDVTIKVQTADLPILDQIAQREWRTPPMQLAAMVEAMLATARTRANTAPRSAPRRTPARSNGAIRVEV